MQKVLIIGCGVIGGSIFKRLASHKNKNYDLTIYDPFMSEEDTKHLIVYCKTFDIQLKQYDPLNYKKDLFDIAIIAVPPQEDIYLQIAKDLQIFTLAKEVYEFSSVKGWLLKLEGYKDANNFTPVHIMAGSEKTGFANSSCLLHLDATIMFFSDDSNLQSHKTIEELGCYTTNKTWKVKYKKKLFMQEHDKIVAWTSHFPQLFCFALNDIINKEHDTELNNALQQISQDWVEHKYLQKNLFRLCQSNRVLWKSIFKQNLKNLLNILEMHDMGYDFSLFKPVKTYGLEGAGYKMMCEYLQSDKWEYLQQILRSDAIKVAMRNILE